MENFEGHIKDEAVLGEVQLQLHRQMTILGMGHQTEGVSHRVLPRCHGHAPMRIHS